jgi:hypothetical protein
MRTVRRVVIYLLIVMVLGYLAGASSWMWLSGERDLFHHVSVFGILGTLLSIGCLAAYLKHELIGIRIFAFFDQDMRLHVHTTRPTGSIVQWKGMRITNRWHRPSNRHDLMIGSYDFINGSFLELTLGGPLRFLRKHNIHGETYSPWTVFRANNLNDIIVRDRSGGLIGGLSIGDLLVVINENEEVVRYVEGITMLQTQLEKLGHATTATIHYLMGGKGKTPSKMAAKGREMLSAAMDSLTLGDIDEINRWTRHAPDVSERFITELEKNPPSKEDPNHRRPKLQFPNVFKRL